MILLSPGLLFYLYFNCAFLFRNVFLLYFIYYYCELGLDFYGIVVVFVVETVSLFLLALLSLFLNFNQPVFTALGKWMGGRRNGEQSGQARGVNHLFLLDCSNTLLFSLLLKAWLTTGGLGGDRKEEFIAFSGIRG